MITVKPENPPKSSNIPKLSSEQIDSILDRINAYRDSRRQFLFKKGIVEPPSVYEVFIDPKTQQGRKISVPISAPIRVANEETIGSTTQKLAVRDGRWVLVDEDQAATATARAEVGNR